MRTEAVYVAVVSVSSVRPAIVVSLQSLTPFWYIVLSGGGHPEIQLHGTFAHKVVLARDWRAKDHDYV